MYRLAVCLVAAAITAIEVTPPAFSTDSPQFVDITGGTFAIPPSPGQTWLVLVSASLWSSTLLYDGPQARYLVDGVERGLGGTEAITADRAGPWQHLYMFTGASAPTTITFQDGMPPAARP